MCNEWLVANFDQKDIIPIYSSENRILRFYIGKLYDTKIAFEKYTKWV